MEAYQLLENINKVSIAAFTLLKPLNKVIEDLYYFTLQEMYLSEAWELTCQITRFQDVSLEMGLFIAAKDDSPTKNTGDAKRNVIFEGWKFSHKTHGIYYIRNESKKMDIEFNDGAITVEFESSAHPYNYSRIETISDLAKVTKGDPLRFKSR
jgi:hypothetical protein